MKDPRFPMSAEEWAKENWNSSLSQFQNMDNYALYYAKFLAGDVVEEWRGARDLTLKPSRRMDAR